MKKKYSQSVSLILVTIFLIFYSQKIYSQDSLSADTPFVEVNGKVIKFGISQSLQNSFLQTFSVIENSLIFFKLLDKRVSKINDLNTTEFKKRLIDQKKNELFNLYSRSHLSKLKNNSLIEYK